MKNQLFIYGAGGLGREILTLVRTLPDWEVAGFVDDREDIAEVMGVRIVGGKSFLLTPQDSLNVVIAIGDPHQKAAVAVALRHARLKFPSLIHPGATLQDVSTIRMGPGTIITAGCVLTTGIKIGSHVLINLNTTVGHDVTIGDYSSIMPGVNIAGQVSIGSAVLLGSGANVLNRVNIGPRSRIGMGSVVINDIGEGITAVGVPAKPVHP